MFSLRSALYHPKEQITSLGPTNSTANSHMQATESYEGGSRQENDEWNSAMGKKRLNDRAAHRAQRIIRDFSIEVPLAVGQPPSSRGVGLLRAPQVQRANGEKRRSSLHPDLEADELDDFFYSRGLSVHVVTKSRTASQSRMRRPKPGPIPCPTTNQGPQATSSPSTHMPNSLPFRSTQSPMKNRILSTYSPSKSTPTSIPTNDVSRHEPSRSKFRPFKRKSKPPIKRSKPSKKGSKPSRKWNKPSKKGSHTSKKGSKPSKKEREPSTTKSKRRKRPSKMITSVSSAAPSKRITPISPTSSKSSSQPSNSPVRKRSRSKTKPSKKRRKRPNRPNKELTIPPSRVPVHFSAKPLTPITSNNPSSKEKPPQRPSIEPPIRKPSCRNRRKRCKKPSNKSTLSPSLVTRNLTIGPSRSPISRRHTRNPMNGVTPALPPTLMPSTFDPTSQPLIPTRASLEPSFVTRSLPPNQPSPQAKPSRAQRPSVPTAEPTFTAAPTTTQNPGGSPLEIPSPDPTFTFSPTTTQIPDRKGPHSTIGPTSLLIPTRARPEPSVVPRSLATKQPVPPDKPPPEIQRPDIPTVQPKFTARPTTTQNPAPLEIPTSDPTFTFSPTTTQVPDRKGPHKITKPTSTPAPYIQDGNGSLPTAEPTFTSAPTITSSPVVRHNDLNG